jgi:predicted N-acetyltransferase YhbS
LEGLDYLAVHPENKGKGIATLLVESGIRAAERMGIDLFVLAFRAGVGVYKRLGFVVVKEILLDDRKFGGTGDYGGWLMIKEIPKVG